MQTFITDATMAGTLHEGAILTISDKDVRPGAVLLKIEEMRDGGSTMQVVLDPAQAEAIGAVLGTLASQARAR